MMYSERLNLLYGLCLHLMGGNAAELDLKEADAMDSAHFLACYVTFNAIRNAGREPAEERAENFDMLSVYQAFALLTYAYFALPLGEEGKQPDFTQAAVAIVKSLFAELSPEEWAEIIESGQNKFQLIGDAESEHWMNYRQDLEKTVLAFVVAGTDEDAPFSQEDILPMFGNLLSMLCEAFDSL